MGGRRWRRFGEWLAAGVAGGGLALFAYQFDEWLTLKQTERVYVSHAQLRAEFLRMEDRINLERLLWGCLESGKAVDVCREQYYRIGHERLLVERQK